MKSISKDLLSRADDSGLNIIVKFHKLRLEEGHDLSDNIDLFGSKEKLLLGIPQSGGYLFASLSVKAVSS